MVALLEGLRAGELFPRWSPDLAYGLGYPFFDFYGALAFYAAASLHLLGLPVVAAIKTTQLLGFLAASGAMFGFARRHLGDAGGLVAAAAYGYAPYHLVNVYARGDSLGEFTAMAFLPLVLWSVETAARGSVRGAAGLATSLAALVLSHNLSALLAGPAVVLWGIASLAFAWRDTRRIPWAGGAALVAGGAAAVGLTCYYWLPALWDRRYVHLEHVTTGYFDFRNHFVGLGRLVQSSPIYDYGLSGTSDGALPFQLGLAQATAALAGLVALPFCVRRRGGALGALGLAIGLGFALMAIPASRPLWEGFETLQIVQFPWRVLAGSSMGLALLAGVPLLALSGRVGTLYALAACALLVASGSVGANPERWRLNDVGVAGVQRYEYLTSSIGSTVRYEYLPLEARERPWASGAMLRGAPPPIARPPPAGSVEVRREPGPAFVLTVGAPTSGHVVLEQHYFPGWSATVDGVPAELRASDPEGLLSVAVPAGEHKVRFAFGETRLRSGARFASLATLILGLGVLALMLRRSGATATAALAPCSAPVVCAGAMVLGLLLGLARVPWSELALSIPSDGRDRRFAHEHAPWPYVEPRGVEVGEGRVSGYVQPDTVPAGGELRVDLATVGSALLRARVVSPAELIVGAPRALVEREVALSSPTTALALPIPSDAAPGLYQVDLAAADGSGRRRQLAPFRVVEGPQVPSAAPLATFGGELALESLALVEPRADRPGLALRWRALAPATQDWRVSLRLTDDAGHVWGSADGRPVDGFFPTPYWRMGQVVGERRDVPTLRGTPAGSYRAEVRVYSLSGTTLDLRDARGAAIAPLFRSAPLTLTAPALEVGQAGGETSLLEWSVDRREVDAGATVPIQLLWRIGSPPREAELVAELGPMTRRLAVPAATWRPGELVRQQLDVAVPPGLDAGSHPLRVRLTPLTESIQLGEVLVRNRPRRFDVPAIQHGVGARFVDGIELLGFDLGQTRLAPGERLPIALYWRARETPSKSYTVFVHLLDADHRVRGQVDSVPGGGSLPTGGWAPGEVIVDRYEVPLDAAAVPGTHALEVGLYDPRDGTRLLLEPSGVDHVVLVTVGVP